MNAQRAFDIDKAIARVREAVGAVSAAMLFELYDDGHTSAFEMLVACLISVRTRDEASLAMARALFARARTPAEMAALDINEIDALIRQVRLPRSSPSRSTPSPAAIDEFGGELPCYVRGA